LIGRKGGREEKGRKRGRNGVREDGKMGNKFQSIQSVSQSVSHLFNLDFSTYHVSAAGNGEALGQVMEI
jgi:hypothetical protein